MEEKLVALRRAGARAVPLAGRGIARPSRSTNNDERAARVFRRWQNQHPFESDDWFERRLAADGTNSEGLRALLAESPDAVADRLGSPEPWIDRLVASFRCPPAPLAIPAEHAFASLVAPLLAAARDRLRDNVSTLLSGHGLSGEPAKLVEHFVPALTAGAHGMAVRTMILELNVARVTGQLGADTPGRRYRQFVERLAEPSTSIDYLIEYPVLARQLTIAAEAWVRANSLLLRRLVEDRAALATTFGAGVDPAQLVEVEPGLGDQHRGAAVARLRFAGGSCLLYKPRPVSVDVHFQRLVEWLNPHLEHPLRSLTYLARPGYGWVENLTAEYCRTTDDVRRFYRRCGSLLALLHLLDATDIHAQNLLAVGDQPVVVDLEALFHPEVPRIPKELAVSEQLADAANRHSVLQTGMLPSRTGLAAGSVGSDVSALGCVPDELASWDSPELVAEGTDEVRIEYRRNTLGQARNRPVPPDQPLRLLDFVPELTAGFTEAYHVWLARPDELRERLMAFDGDETRLLRRGTLEYNSLLRSSFHPDMLRDALARDRHFDRLWGMAARDPGTLPFLAHERADLWANDIPIFTITTGSTDVVSSSGVPLTGAVTATGLASALSKLDRLCDSDLEHQLWICRSAISTAATADDNESLTSHYPCDPPTTDPGSEVIAKRALNVAAAVADRLLQLAYRGPADLTWVGPSYASNGVWTISPMGPDLYSGTAGMALFFDQLAEQTGDPGHRAAADGVRATLRIQTDRRADTFSGGLTSAGGTLYALAHLYAARPERVMVEQAERVVDRLEAVVADDETYDIIGGCAGSIAGLAAWHAVRPGGRVLDAVRACAEKLRVDAEEQQTGVGWLPATLAGSADRPLAGFAHGSAGIAWALTRAAALLGDERHDQTAAAALAYERTLFHASVGNWLDVRHRTGPEQLRYPALWCHGATGVGMARAEMIGVLADDQLADELAIAVRTVTETGFGRNFSLCHGDLGNLDLLLTAAETTSGTEGDALAIDARRYAAAVLDGLETQGWLCGTPGGTEAPSLMVGLAGVGYGLLRIAAPGVVPSVLALRPPTPR